ncbi:hypothetical protein [Sutcliffiella halmapala]|uniref:hypothetical protein n=1 Tax=Sutcliffiella halmapala TaxID=79882 RepID=UPI000995336D|nr:hypothetical protein [Sutcliffiella halmapala]
MTYSPNITEAHIPHDGGWTEDNGVPVLLLSIPSIESVIPLKIQRYSYTWLYEGELDAYILCVQINKKEEFGVVFSQQEAGQLLLDALAYEEFTIVICKEPIEEIDDHTAYLSLPKISLIRSVQAGW